MPVEIVVRPSQAFPDIDRSAVARNVRVVILVPPCIAEARSERNRIIQEPRFDKAYRSALLVFAVFHVESRALSVAHAAVRNRHAQGSRETVALAVSETRAELSRSRFLFSNLKDQIDLLVSDYLDIGIDHVEVVQLHDFAETAFKRRLAVSVSRIETDFAADNLVLRLRVADDVHPVNLGWQAFAHPVFEIDDAVVYKVPGFIELGKEVAVFAVGGDNCAARRLVSVIVEDLSAVQIDRAGKHLVRQGFVSGKVDRTRIVPLPLVDVDVDADILGRDNAVVRRERAERFFERVAGKKLFLVAVPPMLLQKFLHLRIFPRAVFRKILDPSLAKLLVRDDAVQDFDRGFLVLDVIDRNRLSVRGEISPVLAVIVRRLFHDATRQAVHDVRRIGNGLVQLSIKKVQFAVLRNGASHVEVAA